ncbi:MAG: ribonuclease P protein component [Eubacteriales bacterium]|nr:ribonuclease P protein component [Clostridiales bacterium]
MKHISINENHLYSKVYARGKKFVTPTVVVYVLTDYRAARFRKQNPEKKFINRIGLTVTKRNGGAVVRNRCKRVLREALRGVESKYELRGGYLIVLVARDATAYAKSHEVERDLTRAFSRLGMLSGTRQKSQSNEKLS